MKCITLLIRCPLIFCTVTSMWLQAFCLLFCFVFRTSEVRERPEVEIGGEEWSSLVSHCTLTLREQGGPRPLQNSIWEAKMCKILYSIWCSVLTQTLYRMTQNRVSRKNWQDWCGGLMTRTESLWRLRSGSEQRLIVPRMQLRTIGDRSFCVTAARAWNSLPITVTTATSTISFKRQLKKFLFTKSLLDL